MLPFPAAVLGETSFLDAAPTHPSWSAISIRDSDLTPLSSDQLGERKVLQLEFTDVAWWKDRYYSFGWIPCKRADILSAMSFVRDHQHDGLFVHCAQGIRRSSAFLVGVGATLGLSPRQAVMSLQHAVDYAYEQHWRDTMLVKPNLRVIALFDRELDLGGDLLRAVLDAYPTAGGGNRRNHEHTVKDALTNSMEE